MSARSRRARRALPALRLIGLLLIGALVFPGCGSDRYDEGSVVVDNRTDLTTSEDLLTFRISRFGEPYSGNLLGAPLAPTSSLWVGRFREDYYDATGDLQLGGIIDWFDLYVGNDRTTYFEAR